MRKIGIILLVIGIMQAIILILNSTNAKELDKELLITSCSFLAIGLLFYLIGKSRKVKTKKGSKPHKEIGWGKIIMYFFIFSFIIASLGRFILSVNESTFEGQVRKANQGCPIPIADGAGHITSIVIEDSMVVFTFAYDSEIISLDRLKYNPNKYKRAIILSSYLLNGQNKNGDRFMKMILDNQYGIVLKVRSNMGEEFKITASISELKAILKEAEKSPTDAMKEVLEWQLKDNQSTLPIKIDDEMALVAIVCDSTNLIYKVVINEPLSISSIKENDTSMNRNSILRELYRDPSSKANLDMCAVGDFNLVYRYIDEMNADSCDIVFSHREISDIVKIPTFLKIK